MAGAKDIYSSYYLGGFSKKRSYYLGVIYVLFRCYISPSRPQYHMLFHCNDSNFSQTFVDKKVPIAKSSATVTRKTSGTCEEEWDKVIGPR